MEKSGIKGLAIEILNLQQKRYDFEFSIGNHFFKHFEESLIQKGSAKVDVVLDKSETLIELNLSINGTIELICDRSLDAYDYPIELKQQLLYKFGQSDEELDDFMFQITPGTESINLAQMIYEIITLAIPMKKLHPRYGLEDETDEEVTLIYSSAEDQDQNQEQSESDDIDPRWQKLNELKNNKNN